MQDNPLVYSTDKGRMLPSESPPDTKRASGDGIARIRRETKGRKGKGVCTISGLLMDDKQLKSLCSELKKHCGTGGAVKNGIIEIQGDNRNKLKDLLEQKGLTVKLAGG